MTIKVSTGLRTSMLNKTGESLGASLDDGQIDIYAGAVPADADASIGAATLLVTISDNSQAIVAGTGLNFDTAATGVASFYRFVQQADGGASSTTDKRIQGTISTVGADLNLSSTSLVIAGTQSIDAFSITMPTP